MKKLKLALKLFLIMFKIGLFTFGGGYAMIAILENEFVEKRGFITKEEFLDMVAIAESTPGPIAINSATYIGYKTAGVIGSALATLGVVLPSFTIIYIISLFFEAFVSFEIVSSAFKGIQVCVVYLIASAGIKLFKGLKKNAINNILFALVLISIITLNILNISFSSIFYILICGVLGLCFYFIGKLKNKGEKKDA